VSVEPPSSDRPTGPPSGPLSGPSQPSPSEPGPTQPSGPRARGPPSAAGGSGAGGPSGPGGPGEPGEPGKGRTVPGGIGAPRRTDHRRRGGRRGPRLVFTRGDGDSDTSASGGEVFLQAAGKSGPDPFTESTANDSSTPPETPRRPRVGVAKRDARRGRFCTRPLRRHPQRLQLRRGEADQVPPGGPGEEQRLRPR